MAYDETLVDRMRAVVLSATEAAVEKKMFGGMAFMIGGHMACGVTNKGDLMVRVGADNYAACLALPGARSKAEGRPMKGMVFVDVDAVSDAVFIEWIERGVSHAQSLPPKPSKK